MGNGWHEWPLVIFTVLGQCVVGALIVSGIGWFAAKNDADRQHIVRGMFFLWLLMGIGFIGETLVTCQHGARRHFRLDDDLRVSNRHSANLV